MDILSADRLASAGDDIAEVLCMADTGRANNGPLAGFDATIGRTQTHQTRLSQEFAIFFAEHRRHVNDNAFVSRLPAEILSEIFSLLPSQCKYGSLAMLRISHVCWFWRCVSMNNRSLWTHVDISRAPAYVEMLLQRSSGMPTHLSLPREIELSEVHALNSIISRHARWIYHLELGGGSEVSPRCVHELLATHAADLHWLKSLKIVTIDFANDAETSPLDTQNHPLDNLSVTGMGFGWLAPAVRGLRCLTLHEISMEPDDIDALLDCLESCPLLKKLKISASLPSPETSLFPRPDRLVVLSSLCEMDIKDEIVSVSWFCSHVGIPAGAVVSLTCVVDDFALIEPIGLTICDALSLLDAVPRYDRSGWPIFSFARAAELFVKEYGEVLLRVWEDATSRYGPPSLTIYLELDLDFKLEDEVLPTKPAEIFAQVVTLFSSSLLELCFESSWGELPTIDCWRRALHQASLLERLEVTSNMGLVSLLQALGANKQTTKAPCPRLKALCWSMSNELLDDFTLEVLMKSLADRSAVGLRLEYLNLSDFAFVREGWTHSLRELNKLVASLDLDMSDCLSVEEDDLLPLSLVNENDNDISWVEVESDYYSDSDDSDP